MRDPECTAHHLLASRLSRVELRSFARELGFELHLPGSDAPRVSIALAFVEEITKRRQSRQFVELLRSERSDLDEHNLLAVLRAFEDSSHSSQRSIPGRFRDPVEEMSILHLGQRIGSVIALMIWLALTVLSLLAHSVSHPATLLVIIVGSWNFLLALFGSMDGIRLHSVSTNSTQLESGWATFVQLAVIVLRCAALMPIIFEYSADRFVITAWTLTIGELIGSVPWFFFCRSMRSPATYTDPNSPGARAIREFFCQPHSQRILVSVVLLVGAAVLVTVTRAEYLYVGMVFIASIVNEGLLAKWRIIRDRE